MEGLNIEETSLLNEVTYRQAHKKKKVGLSVLVAAVLLLAVGVLTWYSSSGSITTAETEGDPLAYRHEIAHEPLARCNDGSQAVFYKRTSMTGNNNWIVYFDGGNACYSNETCNYRYETDRDHMTAHTEPSGYLDIMVANSDSILSHDKDINPYWWDWNVVYVQYCSSDSFLGNIEKKDVEYYTPYDFLGSEIARGVFRELVGYHGMVYADQVLLTSVSAGSFGAMAHGNYIMDYLAEYVPKADFRVWLDSGFWLLNEPWRDSWAEKDCSTTNWVDCHIDGCHELSFEHFNTVQNEECREQSGYTWECAFPEINLPYLRFPMLVTQQQYDKLQLQGAGLGINQQVSTGIDFTMERGEMWREQLQQATDVWSSNCRKHDIIDKKEVFSITINNEGTGFEDMTANEAAHRWINGEHIWYWDDEYYPDANPTCPDQ